MAAKRPPPLPIPSEITHESGARPVPVDLKARRDAKARRTKDARATATPAAQGADAMARFRELRERERRGDLHTSAEVELYDTLRDSVVRTLAHDLALVLVSSTDERPRLRVPCCIPIRLEIGSRIIDAVTVDLSAVGFAVHSEVSLPICVPCRFRVTMDALACGEARVITCVAHELGDRVVHRASIAIEALRDENCRRLDGIVIDAALALLGA
jgi:hypothetical protein